MATPTYLEPLLMKYEENRDPTRAAQMKKYMKDQFGFYGITICCILQKRGIG